MKISTIKVSLFYCSGSLTAEEISICTPKIDNVELNTICLPCSGRVNIIYLLKAIETGSDAVLLATCKLGDCKYVQGNFRAQKRIDAIDDLLEETGIGKGRIKCIQLNGENKVDVLVTEINKIRIASLQTT